uniref:C-type lectin domain-containing protein n=1 Tax=Panagrolaimus davidi TaxID=227884 RepID=A0A914PIG3_9BILA
MTDFWIGLTNMMPGGNWTWTDGTPLDFTDWDNGEPENITGNNCAGQSINGGIWKTDDCYKTKPYICKVDKTFFDPPPQTTKYPIYANCPFPFTYFQPTHSCYGVGNYTGPLNWTLGQQHCEAFGANLTSIHSVEELLFLGSLVFIGHNLYWTGAFSIDGGNSWKWADGSPWDYNSWANGYPSLGAVQTLPG